MSIYHICCQIYENYYLIGMVYDHPSVKAGNRGRLCHSNDNDGFVG